MSEETVQDRQKKEISALDIRFLVRELQKTLVGGMIRKIYQYGRAGTKQLLFEVFTPGKGAFWLYVDNNKLFLTKRKKATPQEPPSFCMFLRKHLMGKKIIGITQYGFDRIIELTTKDNILIFELFSPGNTILCDRSHNIIMPLEIQKWKTRTIRAKEPYKYPPYVINPFKLDFDELRKSLMKSQKNLLAHLATSLGLGPVYAAEACTRAGLDGNGPANGVGLEPALQLHKAIETMDRSKLKPMMYENIVSPFPLKMNEGKGSGRETESFSDALDDFFSEQEIQVVEEEKKAVVVEEKERIERIIEHQGEASDKWERIEKESREKAELIYNYYSTVEEVLNGIRKARDMNIPWSEIKEKIKQEAEGEAVKEIREGDGIIVVELSGTDVEIDIRKSVEENAARYYEDAKWAKKKMLGAGQAMETQQMLQAQTDTQAEPAVQNHDPLFVRTKDAIHVPAESDITLQPEEVEPMPEPKPIKKLWYEKFKWFFSSNGLLVIAGRDAEQNETIIKKHADPADWAFHADIPGAAFVVIKKIGEDLSPVELEEIPDETRKEAAEFAAANSKAWSKGLGAIDIFSVPVNRVTKTPPSGQHLAKGSFMVMGERVWYRSVELKLCVGVKMDRERDTVRVISGPLMAVKKNSEYFVTIKPGFKKAIELARTIRNRILIKARPEDKYLIEKVSLEDIQNVIPAGMGEVVESARDF
jgi:predicted ribosome quality control (RQC) complex YloA/Tae2 family protein